LFQFQSGAIQSQLANKHRILLKVSIPKWCDSKIGESFFLTFFFVFQFQSGAIQRTGTSVTGSINGSFNSKVVRFKDLCKAGTVVIGLFQFQSGAIQRQRLRRIRIERKRFNSKVVRFKATRKNFFKSSTVMFQFQSGAIQSRSRKSTTRTRKTFQFQSGAIQRYNQ